MEDVRRRSCVSCMSLVGMDRVGLGGRSRGRWVRVRSGIEEVWVTTVRVYRPEREHTDGKGRACLTERE